MVTPVAKKIHFGHLYFKFYVTKQVSVKVKTNTIKFVTLEIKTRQKQHRKQSDNKLFVLLSVT